MAQWQKAGWWYLTGVAALFEGTWVLLGGAPPWWATATAVAAAVAGVIFGRPWEPPQVES